MKSLTIILLVLSLSVVKAQEYNLESFVNIESNTIAFARGMHVDQEGNIYTFNEASGSFNPDPGDADYEVSTEGTQSMVIKYNADMEYQWSAVYSAGSIFAMTTQSNGNVLLTGTFTGTTDFDPGAGVAEATSNGFADIYLLSLNSSGEFNWYRQIGGPGFDVPRNCGVNSNDEIYVAGAVRDTLDVGTEEEILVEGTGSYGAFVIQYDSDGNYEWHGDFSSYEFNSSVNAFHIDENDNLLIGGYVGGIVDADLGAGEHLIGNDDSFNSAFLLKLDSDHNFVSATELIASNQIYAYHVRPDGSGGTYLCGTLTGSLSYTNAFDEEVTISGLSQDTYLARFNEMNEILWISSWGTESEVTQPLDLEVGEDGSSFVCGNMIDTLILTTPENSMQFELPSEEPNALLLKFNEQGESEWSYFAGTEGEAMVSGIALTSEGEILCNGRFTGEIDFAGGEEESIYDSGEGRNLFFMVFQEAGEPINTEEWISNKLSVYPNPTSEFLHLPADCNYEFYSINGQLIDSGQTFSSSRVDLSHLNPGTYLIHISSENVNFTSRLVVVD